MINKASGPILGKHLIGGKWIAEAGATFPSLNPANRDEIVGTFPGGPVELANQAVAAARTAFDPLATDKQASPRGNISTSWRN